MKVSTLLVGGVAGFLMNQWLTPPPATATALAPTQDVETMLEDFVEDFHHDPLAGTPLLFGVRVKDAITPDWHIEVRGGAVPDVSLFEGFPEEPMPFFVTDTATLSKIHRGELASLTAMGKAFSTDFAPLDLDATQGFEPDEEATAHLTRLSFHFWTRGFPEVTRFGDKRLTRKLHGANGVLFYYQPGFRSGWFQIEPGQHVNQDPAEQVNPFPTIMVVTQGRMQARIDGNPVELAEQEMVYIGAGVSHEFWVDESPAAEGVLLMFGEGA